MKFLKKIGVQLLKKFNFSFECEKWNLMLMGKIFPQIVYKKLQQILIILCNLMINLLVFYYLFKIFIKKLKLYKNIYNIGKQLRDWKYIVL